MVGADYSQQEPRTLAYVSGDTDLIQAYKDNRDIYAFIATSVYNVPYEDCLEFYPDGKVNPEGKKRRTACKSVLLGKQRLPLHTAMRVEKIVNHIAHGCTALLPC